MSFSYGPRGGKFAGFILLCLTFWACKSPTESAPVEADAGIDTAVSADAFDAADVATVDAPKGHEPLQMACMLEGPLSGLGLAGMAMDAAGNVYIGGSVGGTVDFDLGPAEHIMTLESPQYFMARINRDCSLAWVQLMDASVVPMLYTSIAVDATGNSYLLGQFATPATQAANFDPGSGYDLHASNGSSDVFLTSFAPDGAYRFTRFFGGPGLDRPIALAVDDKNNVDISGIYQGTVDFDPGPASTVLHATSSSADAYFLAQVGPDGAFHWARHVPDPLYRLRPGSAGEILGFGAGYPGDNQDFDSGFDVVPPCSCFVGYVMAVRNDGSYHRTWFSSLGSGGGFADATLDEAGTQYTLGAFAGSYDFDDGPGIDVHKSISQGSAPGDTPATDLFVRAIHKDGGYGWTHPIGAAVGNTYGSILPSSMRRHGDKLYIAGGYGGLIQDGSTFRNSSSDGGDVFLFAADSQTGRVDWGSGLGSTAKDLRGAFLDVAPDGRIALAGRFGGTADLDLSDGVHSVTIPSGGAHTFILTLDAQGCKTGATRTCSCPGGEIGSQTCNGDGDWATCGACKADFNPTLPCATTCNIPSEQCGKLEACSLYIDCQRCPVSQKCPSLACAIPAPVVLAEGFNHPTTLQVDAKDVYVLNLGSLQQTGANATKDASVVKISRADLKQQVLSTGAKFQSLVADADAVYWFDGGLQAVRRYGKTDGQITTLLAPVNVVDLAVDGAGLVLLGSTLANPNFRLYNVDKQTGALDAGRDILAAANSRLIMDAKTIFVANPTPLVGADKGSLYQIGRTAGAYSLLLLVEAPGPLALDADYVYYGSDLAGRAVMRAPRTGFPPEVVSGYSDLPWGGIALGNGLLFGTGFGQTTQSTWLGNVQAWDAKPDQPFVYARNLNHPTGIAIDSTGKIFVAETGPTSTQTTLGRVLELK
jgi:hypothetical protein